MKIECTKVSVHIPNSRMRNHVIPIKPDTRRFTPGKIYNAQLQPGATKVIHVIDSLGHERMITTDDPKLIVRNNYDYNRHTGSIQYARFEIMDDLL